MKLRKNKKRRVIGKFESMEDRKLLAADLLGAADLIDTAVIDQMEMTRAESTSLGTGEYGKPNPEDDGPLGPIGPVVHTFQVVADALKQVGMPAPDDDDPPGPIGPVFHEDGVIIPQIDRQNADEADHLTTIMIAETGDREAKPDPDVDCDGNPLTASCDILAPELDPEAKPDPDVDCDGNPLTAACDIMAPELDPELWSNPGDTDGDGDSDFSDFLNLAQHFGRRDATRAEGDLDGDRVVGFGDFLILSSHFGTSITPQAADAVFAG